SASPPTLTTQRVATAMASQSRAARSGSVILVWCHCQPPRLMSLNPPSIQDRMPYHATWATSGGRSVSTNQGSACASAQHATSVHCRRQEGVAKQSTSPHHCVPSRGTTVANERKPTCPRGRNCPP